MWPFEKPAESRDKGTTIVIKIRIPTTELSPETIEYEARKRISLFIAEALRRYGDHGLTHNTSTLDLDDGRGFVAFDLEPSDQTIEISQVLGSVWDELSGW